MASAPTLRPDGPMRRTRYVAVAVALALTVGGTALAESSHPARSPGARPVAAVADDPAAWIDSFDAAPAYDGKGDGAQAPVADDGSSRWGGVSPTPGTGGSGGTPRSGTS